MGQNQKNSSFLNLFLPMGLQSFFALAALLLCLSGGLLYKNIQQKNEQVTNRVTAESYFLTRMQQAQNAGAISVRSEGESSVLVILRAVGGDLYETRIWAAGGALREDFVSASQPFSETGGDEICVMQAAAFELSGALVEARFTYENGALGSARFYLEGGVSG